LRCIHNTEENADGLEGGNGRNKDRSLFSTITSALSPVARYSRRGSDTADLEIEKASSISSTRSKADLESSQASPLFNSSPNLVDDSSGMNKLDISGVGFTSGSVEKDAQKAYPIGIGMEIYRNYSSDNSKNVSESDNSEESLRNELDRAMETGDWTEVDKQASQILGTFRESGPNESKENKSVSLSYDDDSDSQDDWSTEDEGVAPSLDGSSIIDNERINMLESLIDSDDWQGIVTVARIHHQNDDATLASSINEIDADQTMLEENDTDLDSLR